METEKASGVSQVIQQETKRRISLGMRVIGVVLVLLILLGIAGAFLLPVYRVTGDSMSPTLVNGGLVLTMKGGGCSPGDVVVLQADGKQVIRRVIAVGPANVVIDEQGRVTVDDKLLPEPYAHGETSVGKTVSYQVPKDQLFLMGDDRTVSVDSRHEAMGCVAQRRVLGKVLMCIWPMKNLSLF